MGEIGEALEHINPFLGGIIALAFVVLTVSKKVAELEGSFRWVGTLARAWNGRQVRKVRRDAELDQAKREERDAAYRSLQASFDAINKEQAALRQMMVQQRSDHDDELEAARLEHREEIQKLRTEHNAEMRSMRRELDLKNDYIVRLFQWGHSARAKAARGGIDLDPMPETGAGE